MPKAGLEPACLAAPPPQDGVSANSTTSAKSLFLFRCRWRNRSVLLLWLLLCRRLLLLLRVRPLLLLAGRRLFLLARRRLLLVAGRRLLVLRLILLPGAFENDGGAGWLTNQD